MGTCKQVVYNKGGREVVDTSRPHPKDLFMKKFLRRFGGRDGKVVYDKVNKGYRKLDRKHIVSIH